MILTKYGNTCTLVDQFHRQSVVSQLHSKTNVLFFGGLSIEKFLYKEWWSTKINGKVSLHLVQYFTHSSVLIFHLPIIFENLCCILDHFQHFFKSYFKSYSLFPPQSFVQISTIQQTKKWRHLKNQLLQFKRTCTKLSYNIKCQDK